MSDTYFDLPSRMEDFSRKSIVMTVHLSMA